jgi:hypothetical protein
MAALGRDEPVDDGSPVRGSTSPTRDYDASIDRQWVLSTLNCPIRLAASEQSIR